MAQQAPAAPLTLPRPAPAPVASAQGMRGRGLRITGTPYARRIAAITAGGAVLRVTLLGHQPLWRDEAFTELASRRSWSGMLEAVRHDSAPPLSYVLTHLSTSVWDSAAALRSPSALAGTAAIPLAAALGRRLGGDRAGSHAAGMAALMPALLVASRDARMYALAGVLVLAFTLVLWRAVEAPSRGRLAVLSAVAAAALMTQYLTVLPLVCGAIAALFALRPSRTAALRCGVALVASTIPVLLWVPFATAQFQHAGTPFWVKPLSGETMLGVLTQFFAGPAVDNGLPHRDLVQWAQAGAITLGGVAGLWLILSVPRMTSPQRRAHALLLGTGLGAVLLLLLISLRTPLFEARYASVMWTPLAVLLGCGTALMRPKRLASLPLGAMAAASLLLAWVPNRADVPAVAGTLRGHVHGADVVLADPDMYLQALLVLDDDAITRTHIPQGSIEWYWGVAIYPPTAYLGRIPEDAGTVYVIDHPWASTPRLPLPPGYHLVQGSPCATDVCLFTWRR